MQEMSDVLGNRYKFLETLGSGGLATVVKALDKHLDSIVAIKVLQKQLLSEKDFVRFQNEAKISARLDHENIVKVMDFGLSDGGSPYMVMEYLEGKTLRDYIEEGYEFQEEEIGALALQIAEGLQHAHSKSVVHSDLTPGNIVLLESKEGEWLVKLIDFGTAFLKKRDTSGFTINVSGAVAGTPSYMSPEQCKGDKPDQRSDIYSLGCILYEVFEGKKLFTAESIAELCAKHVKEPAPVAENAGFLKQIIERCLSKDPLNRYASAHEFKESINESFNSQIEVIAHGKPKRSIARIVLLAASTACILILVLYTGASFYNEHSIQTKRKQVQDLLKKAKTTDYGKSREYLNKAIYLDPENYTLRMMRGKQYYEHNNYDSALLDFKEALNASPRSYETIKAIADLYKHNLTDGVRKSLNFVIEQLKNYPDYEKLYDLAYDIIVGQQNKLEGTSRISEERYDAYINSRNLAEALERMSPDILDNGLHSKVSKYSLECRRMEAFNLSRMYETSKELKLVSGTLSSLAKEFSNKYTEKILDPVIEAKTKQIETNPRDSEALYSRAYAYYKLGEVKLALDDLKQFVENTNSERLKYFTACQAACLAPMAGEDFNLHLYLSENAELLAVQKSLLKYVLSESTHEPLSIPQTIKEMFELSPLSIEIMALTGTKLAADGKTDKAISYLIIPALSGVDKPSQEFSTPLLVRMISKKYGIKPGR